MACRPAQTPLYVRAPAPHVITARDRHGIIAASKALIFPEMRNGNAANVDRGGTNGFRSLRLSVRTPPFHGGESGSIPLGSATDCGKLFRGPADPASPAA